MIQDATQLLIQAGAIKPKPVARTAPTKRQAICETCERYGSLSDILMPFEIQERDRRPTEKVCTHPNCGCWRGVRRQYPWLRLKQCPDSRW